MFLSGACKLMESGIFPVQAELEGKHWWFVARRKILAALVNRVFPAPQEGAILDVGCGTGGNIGHFADAYRCIGIDPTPVAIELGKERFPKVQFICGMAPDDLGELMDQVRLVLLTDVLEHVPDDFEMLSKLWKAAAPGCLFLITVPADERLWSPHDESHAHYRRYDQERLERIWQDLPATPLLVSYFNSRLYPLIRSARQVSRWLGRGSGVNDSDLKMPAGITNKLLRNVFAGEATGLLKQLDGKRSSGPGYGVSLIALVRREAGEVTPYKRPDDVPNDLHHPTENTPSTPAAT